MDLFSQLDNAKNQASIADSLGEEWARFLPCRDMEYFPELMSKVHKEYEDHVCYPPYTQIFRIFHDMKPKDIRVVILGQDPYHNGNANGYAFACANIISPSLKNIVEAIRKDVGKDKPSDNSDMSLKYLVDQGVMLLNTSLSVQAGQPNSHKYLGWRYFTGDVIRSLNKLNNIIWLLWGTDAKSLSNNITNSNHTVMIGTHPASAAHNATIWSCDHFSKTNKILIDRGQEPIKWF